MLRRPTSYSGSDPQEFREVLFKTYDHLRATLMYALAEAHVALMELGPKLPANVKERRKVLMDAICTPFKATGLVPGDQELSERVDQEFEELLPLLSK